VNYTEVSYLELSPVCLDFRVLPSNYTMCIGRITEQEEKAK